MKKINEREFMKENKLNKINLKEDDKQIQGGEKGQASDEIEDLN